MIRPQTTCVITTTISQPNKIHIHIDRPAPSIYSSSLFLETPFLHFYLLKALFKCCCLMRYTTGNNFPFFSAAVALYYQWFNPHTTTTTTRSPPFHWKETKWNLTQKPNRKTVKSKGVLVYLGVGRERLRVPPPRISTCKILKSSSLAWKLTDLHWRLYH